MSPLKHIVKDYDVEICISTEEMEKLEGFIFFFKIM